MKDESKSKASSMNSMRRKVIGDSKNDRDLNSSMGSQESLLNDISSKLDNQQAASELIADVIETKSNEVSNSIGSLKPALGDILAGTELTSEAIETNTSEIRELNSIASKISDKLSKLSDMLNGKIESSLKIPSASSETGLSVIENAIPVTVVPDGGLADEVEKMLPAVQGNNPDSDFLPELNAPEQENQKDKEKEGVLSISDSVKALLKTTDVGFKKTLGVSDRIAGMLFNYTVSAAIGAAKMAALILSVVIGIDLLMIHFKYWSDRFNKAWDKFNSTFDGFMEEAGTWGKLLSDMFGSLKDIKEAWENNDWAGLAGAIVMGLGKLLYNLGELIELGLTKLTASIIRLIPGGTDIADAMEATALEGFQERTGNKLSDEDQDKVAKYKSKKITEGENLYDKAKSKTTEWFNFVTGRDDKSDFTTDDEQAVETAKLKAMSEEDRIAAIKKSDILRGELISLSDYTGNIDPKDKKNVASLNKGFEDISRKLEDPSLNLMPATKKELQGRLNNINIKREKVLASAAPEAQPASSAEGTEAKQVQGIEKTKAEKESKKEAASLQTTNVNTSMVNNSKVIHNTTPITSTPAPGIFGAVGIN